MEKTVRTIKFEVKYIVEVGTETHVFEKSSWDDVMDALNIPNDKNLRTDLFREIFCFHVLDLSEAYGGYHVKIVAEVTEKK